MKKIFLLGALVLAFGVSAETFGQRRIRDGVQSGRITREEARVLRAQRREIRRDRREYRRQYRSEWRDDDRRGRRRSGTWDSVFNRGTDRRRGNGYYRRGAGSDRHPVFGVDGKHSGKHNRRW
jgi:hypothetical protein